MSLVAAARTACADRTSCPAAVHSSASAGENPWLPHRIVSSSDRPSPLKRPSQGHPAAMAAHHLRYGEPMRQPLVCDRRTNAGVPGRRLWADSQSPPPDGICYLDVRSLSSPLLDARLVPSQLRQRLGSESHTAMVPSAVGQRSRKVDRCDARTEKLACGDADYRHFGEAGTDGPRVPSNSYATSAHTASAKDACGIRCGRGTRWLRRG